MKHSLVAISLVFVLASCNNSDNLKTIAVKTAQDKIKSEEAFDSSWDVSPCYTNYFFMKCVPHHQVTEADMEFAKKYFEKTHPKYEITSCYINIEDDRCVLKFEYFFRK